MISQLLDNLFETILGDLSQNKKNKKLKMKKKAAVTKKCLFESYPHSDNRFFDAFLSSLHKAVFISLFPQ